LTDEKITSTRAVMSGDQLEAMRRAAAEAAARLAELPREYVKATQAFAEFSEQHHQAIQRQVEAAKVAAAALDDERRAAIKRIMDSALIPPSYLSSIAKVAEATKQAVDGFAAAHATWNRAAATFLKPLQDVFARIALEERKARLISDCGWLPHETMPFDSLGAADAAPDEIDTLIEAHYRDNWPAIEEALLRSVERYDIDAEAKATYREALVAHRLGLHRVAPRLLFPEIERVVSVELYDGEHSSAPAEGSRKQPITSLKEVREAIQQMPAGDVLSYSFSIGLLDRLDTHLYAKVGDDPGDLARFEGDPVPNRHAALHGLVVYRSRKTSLNALIMTDFIFHLVSRLKRHIDRDGGGEIQQGA